MENDQLIRSRSEIIVAVAESLRQTAETATDIEIVVNRTNISEHEIVSEFGGVHGLVLALVSQLTDALSVPLLDLPQSKEEFAKGLLQFGRGVAEASSQLRGMYRIAITESIRNGGHGREFYEIGPNLLTQRLASFLEGARLAGVIGPVDSHLAAEHFLSLMRASLDLVDGSSISAPTKEAYAHIAAERAFSLFNGGILGQGE
jgi:hypothetical protein